MTKSPLPTFTALLSPSDLHQFRRQVPCRPCAGSGGPKGTPCAHCQGSGRVSQLICALRIDTLQGAVRGDWVAFCVRFPVLAADGTPGEETELVTGKILAREPASGLIQVKIVSNPEQTLRHGLAFGQDFTFSELNVLQHDAVTAQVAAAEEHLITGVMPVAEPINEDDRKLRERASSMPAIVPEVGSKYWLRNGTPVRVWTMREGKFLGQSEAGEDLEWNPDGTHASRRELDIVRSPSAVAVPEEVK